MPPENKSSSAWEIIKFALVTLVIVIPVRAYVAQPFIVSGTSMDPTYKNGDYLIIDELTYQFRPPARDEVIVFRYPNDPAKFFIKRVIGLPGETVRVGAAGTFITKVDGTVEKLSEPYAVPFAAAVTTKTLKAGEYFVLGDNRPVSLDSRVWGVLPANLITGRALVRLFPPNKIGLLI